MSYVEHKMGKSQCAACNRKKKHLSNAPHLLWWPRVMTVIVNGSKHEKNQNEKRCKTGQNSSWMWRCVLRHLTECQVLFLSETSKIFQESQVRHSKEKSQPLKRKIRGRPKEKSDLAKKKPQKLFGVKANVVFFWIDHACASSPPPKLFRKFFLLTKNGFWQTGPNSILWKSVRSTLIFWPLKNLYWRAQGNQLWTVSHELCYISSEKATYIVFIFSHFHRCVVCPQHVKPMQWRWNVSMWNCGWCLVAFKMQTGLGRQDWDGSLATQTGGRHCCSSWTDQSQMFIVDKLDQSRQRRTVDWWAYELNMLCRDKTSFHCDTLKQKLEKRVHQIMVLQICYGLTLILSELIDLRHWWLLCRRCMWRPSWWFWWNFEVYRRLSRRLGVTTL